ncbi:MAG: VCBS repeat-containing protein, partial [Bacteroidia bacterium]|nr:VCBS repeat-containing protein [Bacteroidia bacterium]
NIEYLYLNGTLLSQRTISTPIVANGNNMLSIGNCNDQKFQGLLDDIRIYNRALTPAEIWSLYKENVVTPPTVQNNSRCGSGTLTLTASGADSTETYKWFASATDTTVLGTGANFITPALTQTDTFYVCIDSAGYESARVPVIATVFLYCTNDFSLIYRDNTPSAKTVVGDVNNDGENEMVISKKVNTTTQRIVVYKYNGTCYDSLWSITYTCYQAHPLIADANNDGKNELIVSTDYSDAGSYVKIYTNSGNNWTEVYSNTFATIRDNRGVSVGDLDGDGKNELVVGVTWYNRVLRVFNNTGGNNFNETWSVGGNDFNSTFVGDCDNDGKKEILATCANWSWWDWRIYKHNGTTYQLNFDSDEMGNSSGIVGDADNDGFNEVLIGSNSTNGHGINNFNIYKWNGSTYALNWSWNQNKCSRAPAIGKLTSSGKNQIAIFSMGNFSYDNGDRRIHIFEHNGTDYSEIWTSEAVATPPGIFDLQIGDIDNDGINELVFSNWSDGTYIYKNVKTTGPIVSDTSRCGAGLISLFASGADAGEIYKWYDTPGSCNPIKIDTATTSGFISMLQLNISQTQTYYVCIDSAGFMSQSIPATATINPSPANIIDTIDTNPVTAGLIAYYPFNGNANDESGNGNNGTVNGATLTTDRFGNVNKAYSFDGNDYISLSNFITLGTQFSFSYWAKWVQLYDYGDVFGSEGRVSAGLTYSDGHIAFIIGNGSSWGGNWCETAAGTLTTGQWYLIAGSYDGAYTKLFINGGLVDSAANSFSIPSGTYHIGERNSYYHKGIIDNFRLYNRALTLQEIQSLYTEGQPLSVSLSADTLCSGSNTSLQIHNTQAGVSYQLNVNGSSYGSPQVGNGDTSTFEIQYSAFNIGNNTVTITATDTATSCSIVLDTVLHVVVNPIYSISESVAICEGQSY